MGPWATFAPRWPLHAQCYSKVHAKEQEEVVRESLQGGKQVSGG